MADASFMEATFDIPTIAASTSAKGYIAMKTSTGIITNIRVAAAGASTDYDVRLGNASMATDRAEHIWLISAVNGAGYDDSVFVSLRLTDNKLYWRVKNDDGVNATGVITVTLVFDTAFGINPVDDLGTATTVA